MNRRIALCIGVAEYRAPELELRNPVNDARSIDGVLRARGFESTLLSNPTAAELTHALTSLRLQLAGRADSRVFAVVFYAGHAIEFGGFGVLLPSDMPYPVTPSGLAHFGVPVLEIVDALKMSSGPKIVMVDACRSSVESWNGAQLHQFSEWAQQETERLTDASELENVAIAYSTTAGQPAYDGGALKSLYCEKLGTALSRHDLTVVEALTSCGQNVIADTRARQRPWVYTNLSMKAGFSDLPTYSLVTSTTLSGAVGPGTRVLIGASDDALAMNLTDRVQFLRDGVEEYSIHHSDVFTAAAVWRDEVLLAGPKNCVSLLVTHKGRKQRLKRTSVLRIHCEDPNGIAIAPDGASAIVYGSRGYSVLERTSKGWRTRYSSERLSHVYCAIFQSARVAYLCGSADHVLRLTLDQVKPRIKKISLGRQFHVYNLAWIAQRGSIAAVCNGGVVFWIDFATCKVEGRTTLAWPSVDLPGAYGRLRRMELSPAEANLFLTDLLQFEAQHGKYAWQRTHRESRPDYDLLCCDATADSRVFAVGSDAGLIFLFDVRSLEHFATLDAGSAIGVPLQWMACAANGAIHALGRDGIVRYFEPVYPLI